jgi:hypothetical protein
MVKAEGSERQNAQRGLIGIWTECELGKENARIDDGDLYSLRAIRVLGDRCATGRVEVRRIDEWCGGVTLYFNYSAPSHPFNALIYCTSLNTTES